jgi:hypothetical protein
LSTDQLSTINGHAFSKCAILLGHLHFLHENCWVSGKQACHPALPQFTVTFPQKSVHYWWWSSVLLPTFWRKIQPYFLYCCIPVCCCKSAGFILISSVTLCTHYTLANYKLGGVGYNFNNCDKTWNDILLIIYVILYIIYCFNKRPQKQMKWNNIFKMCSNLRIMWDRTWQWPLLVETSSSIQTVKNEECTAHAETDKRK